MVFRALRSSIEPIQCWDSSDVVAINYEYFLLAHRLIYDNVLTTEIHLLKLDISKFCCELLDTQTIKGHFQAVVVDSEDEGKFCVASCDRLVDNF